MNAKLKKLLNLKINWDSYGAKQINKNCVLEAQVLLDLMAQKPFIVPVCNGGINLEWNNNNFYISLKIRVNEKPRVFIRRRVL